jgi:hypothetical protein
VYTMRPVLQNRVQRAATLELKRLSFQVWLANDDAARYAEVRAKARERQPYSKDSDLNRRLLGLDKGQELLTDHEVLYFRGEAERPKSIPVQKLIPPKKSAKKKGTNDAP